MIRRLNTMAAVVMVFALTAGVARAEGDPKRGEKVFETCHACHSADGAANEVGPGLRGIFGRRAGERDDFRYSPALKRSGITWTPETMNDFLADPQKMVPANRMPYDGVPNERDRVDLISYMLQVFK
jgi:cytochrome c2